MLRLATLALLGALALIVALEMGWNSPRPRCPPDRQVTDGPYTLEIAPASSLTTLLGHPVRDFTLEMEATPLASPDFNDYGLVYRAQNDAHYYVFAIGSDGYYAVLRINGDEERALVDWQQFPHIRRGAQTNRLRVTCAGPTCHFYINDEYVTMVEDREWPAGDVGPWARSRGDLALTVRFLGVRIWDESPFPNP